MTRIVIDPVARAEGHLRLELSVDDTKHTVSTATVTGSMYRGFENIVLNRDPRDAAPILSAICGVCHSDHHLASVRAVENAAGMLEYKDGYSTEGTSIPPNAVLSRNLIAGADWAYSHTAHLLALAGPDYHLYGLLTPTSPLSGISNYADLLHEVVIPAQQYMHQTITLWGGKAPHQRGSIPGGNPVRPTADVIGQTRVKIRQLRAVVDSVAPTIWNYLTDNASELGALGPGTGNFLCLGGFPDPTTSSGTAKMSLLLSRGVILSPSATPVPFDPGKITENVDYSWYDQPSTVSVLGEQAPVPDMSKPGAYTWGKAPGYGGAECECGPLARAFVSGLSPRLGRVLHGINDAVEGLPLNPKGSVFDRMVARALELVALVGTNNTVRNLTMLGEDLNLSLTDVLDSLGLPVLGLMETWLNGMDVGGVSYNPSYSNPGNAEGIGLWEAPRGALLHWIKINAGKVSLYQVIAPSTWNACHAGPLETSLIGTPVGETGTSDDLRPTSYVVRSFDLCGACNVHMIDSRGNDRYLRVG
jgi:Ni,Fe-hydrogenase I large subunit